MSDVLDDIPDLPDEPPRRNLNLTVHSFGSAGPQEPVNLYSCDGVKKWTLGNGKWLNAFVGFLNVFFFEQISDVRLSLFSMKEDRYLFFRIANDAKEPIRAKTAKAYAVKVAELDTLDGKYSGEQITIALKFPHEHYARSFHAIVTQHIVSFSPPISAVPQRLIPVLPRKNQHQRNSRSPDPVPNMSPNPIDIHSPSYSEREEDVSQNWQCQMCTSINAGALQYCEMCGTYRTSFLRRMNTNTFEHDMKHGAQYNEPVHSLNNGFANGFVNTFEGGGDDDNMLDSQFIPIVPDLPGGGDHDPNNGKDPVAHISLFQPRTSSEQHKVKNQKGDVGTDLEAANWECPTCTFQNSGFLNECEICHSRNPTSPQHQQQENPAEWPRPQDMEPPKEEDFVQAVHLIASVRYVDEQVFETLEIIVEKLYQPKRKYRVLDTQLDRVAELLGFEGVLEFLELLSFRSDPTMSKLIVINVEEPPHPVLDAALQAIRTKLQEYEQMRQMKRYRLNTMLPSAVVPDSDPAADGPEPGHITGGGDLGALSSDEIADDVGGDDWTVEQLIGWITHEKVDDTEGTFKILCLCLHQFTNPEAFFESLLNRHSGPYESTEAFVKRAYKVGKVIKHWVTEYWQEDFHDDERLQECVRNFAEALQEIDDTTVKTCGFNIQHKMERKHKQEIERVEEAEKSLVNSNSFGDKRQSSKMRKILALAVDSQVDLKTVSAELLSQQLCIIDQKLFKAIRARELVNQNWKRKNKQTLAPNVLKMIDQFNQLSKWVQIEILLSEGLKQRVELMIKFLKVSDLCMEKRNYNSANAIYAGLSADPIYKLKAARNKITGKDQNLYTKLQETFTPRNGFRNLRHALRNASKQGGIPHIGIFLQDLFNIDEGQEDKAEIGGIKQLKTLNFPKCKRLSERIQFMQGFSRHEYNFDENLDVQATLMKEFQKQEKLDQDALTKISRTVREKDLAEAEKKKKGFWG